MKKKPLSFEQIRYISKTLCEICDAGVSGAIKLAELVQPQYEAKMVRRLFFQIPSYQYCSLDEKRQQTIKDGVLLQEWLVTYLTPTFYKRVMAAFRQHKFHQKLRQDSQRVYGISKAAALYSAHKAKQKGLGKTQGEVISHIVETFILLENTVERINQQSPYHFTLSVLNLLQAAPVLCQLQALADKNGLTASEMLGRLVTSYAAQNLQNLEENINHKIAEF